MGLDISFYKGKLTECGYFRKVNFLMSMYPDSEDANCMHHRIAKEEIEDLVSKCRKVLEDRSLADELLPTREGFFFGTYEYDECYFKDVRNVLEWAEKILSEWDDEETLFMQAWW